jgi:hypothetical protein
MNRIMPLASSQNVAQEVKKPFTLPIQRMLNDKTSFKNFADGKKRQGIASEKVRLILQINMESYGQWLGSGPGLI